MSREVLHEVGYACPGCGIALTAATTLWRDWVQCPTCGAPGRPPLPRMVRRPDPDVLYIGASEATTADPKLANGSALPANPLDFRGPFPSAYEEGRGSGRRMLLGLMFFLATFLAIVSVVQRNRAQAGVFGFVALVLILLLTMAPRRDRF